jgi:hypothetical protein
MISVFYKVTDFIISAYFGTDALYVFAVSNQFGGSQPLTITARRLVAVFDAEPTEGRGHCFC